MLNDRERGKMLQFLDLIWVANCGLCGFFCLWIIRLRFWFHTQYSTVYLDQVGLWVLYKNIKPFGMKSLQTVAHCKIYSFSRFHFISECHKSNFR